MSHIVRLIQGFDLRNPTRTLDLTGSGINLVEGGFAPGPGKLNTRWSGQNPRRNGQKRTGSNRDNVETVLKYVLVGTSQTDMDVQQRKINSFFRDTCLFEEEMQTEPVWVMLLWGETGGLEILPAPVLGQFARYIRLLKGEVESWPESLYTTDLDNPVQKLILNIEMQLTYEPFYYGLPERNWSAAGDVSQTIYGVALASGTDPTWLRRTLTDELASVFTLSIWVVVDFAPPGAVTRTVFHYYVDADDQLILVWDVDDGWELTFTHGGDDSAMSGAPTPAEGDLVHFLITYDGTDLIMYVNGALPEDVSDTPSGALDSDGLLGLGSPADTDGEAGDFILDGLRIFKGIAFTADQAATLYSAELYAKRQALMDDQNNAWIGPPTYWLTTAGDDVLANISHGVLGGVSGDVDALVKWDIKPADLGDNDETTVMWLSRRAVTDIDAVAAAIPLLAASHTFGGAGEANFGDNLADETVRGHAQFLAYISVTGADIDVKPYLPFQTDFEVTTIEDTGGYLLYDLGEIFRNWPMFQAAGLPTQVGFNGVAAGASDFDASFFVILPDPMCRLEAVEDVDGASFTFTNADYKLVLTDDSAYGAEEEDPGIETQRKYFEKRGPGITAEPGKYNAVFIMNGAEGTELGDEEWVVVPYITPRWLLPGGLVA